LSPVLGLGLLLVSAACLAQGVGMQGLASSGPNDRRPLDIQADDGIEWQQNNNVYIAHGNARATRGNATVLADTLIAYYRPAGQAKPEAKEGSASSSFGQSDIYRVEAEGNVRIETETQTVYGD